jgi:hypothetical protein
VGKEEKGSDKREEGRRFREEQRDPARISFLYYFIY